MFQELQKSVSPIKPKSPLLAFMENFIVVFYF